MDYALIVIGVILLVLAYCVVGVPAVFVPLGWVAIAVGVFLFLLPYFHRPPR